MRIGTQDLRRNERPPTESSSWGQMMLLCPVTHRPSEAEALARVAAYAARHGRLQSLHNAESAKRGVCIRWNEDGIVASLFDERLTDEEIAEAVRTCPTVPFVETLGSHRRREATLLEAGAVMTEGEREAAIVWLDGLAATE